MSYGIVRNNPTRLLATLNRSVTIDHSLARTCVEQEAILLIADNNRYQHLPIAIRNIDGIDKILLREGKIQAVAC